MAKVAPEESLPSYDSSKMGPDFFGYYRVQLAELLSEEDNIPQHELEAPKKSSTENVGAKISNLRKEKLNALLRQCVQDLIPEVDEIQSRGSSLQLMAQLNSVSPTNGKSLIPEDPNVQVILKSDPRVVRNAVSKHLNALVARVNYMQQQVENLLDKVATTCSPMIGSQKRELHRSIKELPNENLNRVARIIKDHYAASGKVFSDKVVINMEKEDNLLLWRLHFYVCTVKNARKLAILGNSRA